MLRSFVRVVRYVSNFLEGVKSLSVGGWNDGNCEGERLMIDRVLGGREGRVGRDMFILFAR